MSIKFIICFLVCVQSLPEFGQKIVVLLKNDLTPYPIATVTMTFLPMGKEVEEN
jgi:hypothetical protein